MNGVGSTVQGKEIRDSTTVPTGGNYTGSHLPRARLLRATSKEKQFFSFHELGYCEQPVKKNNFFSRKRTLLVDISFVKIGDSK